MKENKICRGNNSLYRIRAAVIGFIVGPAIVLSFLNYRPSSNISASFSGFFSIAMAVENDKQKADIEELFNKVEEALRAMQLRNFRSTIELIQFKVDKIKKEASSEEIASYTDRIEKAKKAATTAEDLLVNKAYEILSSQGSDSALFYTGNELRLRGVSENKISVAEKKILKEGPAIKQAKDQEAIARMVKLLESGQKPDPSTDRFILQSAQRIVKTRADSIKAIEDVKSKKDMEEQKRQEKARLEKEKKDKKLEEERLAVLKKEEEKKQREIEKAEKKRLTDEDGRTRQMQEAQEKARKDSIETARQMDEGKEAARREAAKRLEEAKLTLDRKPQAEDEYRPKVQAKQEKARRDSIEAQRKTQEDLASHQEELRRMMEDELKEKQRQTQLEEERQNKLLMKHQAEQQEKARRDSIEAYRKEQELLKQQEKERRLQMAKKERERSREKENKYAASQFGKTQDEASEAQRWGQIGTAGRDEQQEEQREKDRMARLIEEERQKRSTREVQEVQYLAKQEKARQDSMEGQRRVQEQRDNQYRIVEERKMKAQLEKERRLAEEQKRQEQLENQRRMAEERKIQTQQEKERRLAEDQRKREQLESQRRLAAEWREKEQQENLRWQSEERKTKDRYARDEDRQEKTRKLTADVQIPETTKPDMEQDEIQRLLENVRKEKERLTRLEQQLQQQIINKQEQARQDSIEEAAKRYRLAQVTRQAPKDDPETRRRILQSDEERKRQLLGLQEKARLDYQRKLDEEKAKIERDRQRWLARQQESMRQDASSGKRGFINVSIDKDAAKYDEGGSDQSSQTSLYFSTREEKTQSSSQKRSSYDRPTEPQQSEKVSRSSYDRPTEQQQSEKAPRENEWKAKEKRRRAEKFVADIYKFLEKNQLKKARQSFDTNRDYIGQYADPEVLNMLEQTISGAENVPTKTPSKVQSSAEMRSSGYDADVRPRAPISQPPPVQYSGVKERVTKTEPVVSKAEPVVSAEVNWEGNELEYISRINGFVRDGNGKAAYKEFKKVEEQLRNYFTTEEFNHFKSMVENANKSRD